MWKEVSRRNAEARIVPANTPVTTHPGLVHGRAGGRDRSNVTEAVLVSAGCPPCYFKVNQDRRDNGARQQRKVANWPGEARSIDCGIYHATDKCPVALPLFRRRRLE